MIIIYKITVFSLFGFKVIPFRLLNLTSLEPKCPKCFCMFLLRPRLPNFTSRDEDGEASKFRCLRGSRTMDPHSQRSSQPPGPRGVVFACHAWSLYGHKVCGLKMQDFGSRFFFCWTKQWWLYQETYRWMVVEWLLNILLLQTILLPINERASFVFTYYLLRFCLGLMGKHDLAPTRFAIFKILLHSSPILAASQVPMFHGPWILDAGARTSRNLNSREDQ